MWMVYLCIGVGIGMGIATLWADRTEVMLEIKRLDREIHADLLECAKEERRAAALRVIIANERQAMNKEIETNGND